MVSTEVQLNLLQPTQASCSQVCWLFARFAQINYICLVVVFSLRWRNGGGELGGDFIYLHLFLHYMRERWVLEHCLCLGTTSIYKKWFKPCYLHKAFLYLKADVRVRFLSLFYWIYLFSVNAASAFITAISFFHSLLLPRPIWEHSYSVAVLQMHWSQFDYCCSLNLGWGCGATGGRCCAVNEGVSEALVSSRWTDSRWLFLLFREADYHRSPV